MIPFEPDVTQLQPTTTYPAMLHKQYQTYIATSTIAQPVTLKGSYSDVQIDVPRGMHGTLVGHVDLNPKKYLEQIPENECIIAAIPDFTFITNENTQKTSSVKRPKFQLKVRHTLESMDDLKYIRVRHGDIHNDIKFELIPQKDNNQEQSEIFWEADTDFITITTTHFSQYLCTSCKIVCDTKLIALVTGSIHEIDSTRIAESVIFLCPLQYNTKDYQKVSNLRAGNMAIKTQIMSQDRIQKKGFFWGL